MNLDLIPQRTYLDASACKWRAAMLTAETILYAVCLIRSAEGYARLMRCKFMRRVKPDYRCR